MGTTHLLATVDELVATLLREVLLGQQTLTLVKLALRVVFVLLRHTIQQTVLRAEYV